MSDKETKNTPPALKPRDQELLDEIEALEAAHLKANAPEDPPTEDPAEETKPKPAEDDDGKPVDYEKRFKDSQRYIQEIKDKHDVALEAKDVELAAKEVAISELGSEKMDMPTTPEELREWEEKYPAMAAVIKTIAMQKAGEVQEEVAKTQAELVELKNTRDKEVAKTQIMGTHPDYVEITGSNEFFEWVKAKPKQFNFESTVYESADVEAINSILTQYKAEKGIKKRGRPKKSANEAAAATTITSNTTVTPDEGGESKIFTESQVKAMTLDEFVSNEKAITQSQRDGTFVYDISAA